MVTAMKIWSRSTVATRCVFTSRSGKAHRKASGTRNTRNGSNYAMNIWTNTVLVKHPLAECIIHPGDEIASLQLLIDSVA